MLLVTSLKDSHLETRVKWMLNEEIYLKMPVPYPASIEDTMIWFQSLSSKKDVRIDFTVLDLASKRIIAFIGLVNYNKQNSNAEFYIFLDPTVTGKGFGSIVMKWLTNYSFSIWQLHKLYCHTIAHNIGANNFYERIGFTHEGQLIEHMFFHEEFVNRNIYGFLQAKWETVSWKQLLKPQIEYLINTK